MNVSKGSFFYLVLLFSVLFNHHILPQNQIPFAAISIGKEASESVNRQQKPSNYEITWYATDGPSEAYFYQLKLGEAESSSGQIFTQTKKMILSG